MRTPLTGLCIAFSLGILAAAYLEIHFLLFSFLAFLFLIAAVIFIRQDALFNILILCAAFFLGGLLLKNSQILSNCNITKIVPYGSDAVSLTGVIDSDPVRQAKNVSFILRAEKLKIKGQDVDTCGRILVRVYRENGFSYGERLSLEGKLYRPFSFSKGFNYREYLRRQNICLILSVKKDGTIEKLDKNTGNPLKSFAFRIKHRLRDVINRDLSPFSAGMLNALILGERQNLPRYVTDVLVNLGTVHIIAISGFNLGIVAFITLLILKIMRIPRKPCYILTMLFLIVYCILTGANTPVVRATVMAIVLLFGYLLERKVNIYNSLSLAALIILAFNPWQIFEISFQLSFLSVISIVWLTPKIKSVFPAKLDKIAWVRFLILTFSVSAAAWFGLLPLLAFYFGIFTPMTVLANMIIVPYSAIITASGFGLALIGVLTPSIAPIFALTNELLILLFFRINYFLVNIPGAYFKLPRVSFTYVLLYYALLILIFNSRKIKNQLFHF